MKVLVADDDSILSAIYTLILRRANITVITANDGWEAVSKFIDERPEVVILDNKMPKYTGIEAATKILAIRPSTKIIMLTSDSKALQDAESVGIDLFLPKPISMKKLLESVIALSLLHTSYHFVSR
jgi:two-component system response regulator (stage 0 sporulation protein F)